MIVPKNKQEIQLDKSIKLIGNFFGFDIMSPQQTDFTQSITTASTITKNHQKSKGILVLKNHSKSLNKLQKRPSVKSLTTKKKWDDIMKLPIKLCRSQIIKLLKQQIPIYCKVLIYLLKNTQKITPKLYNLRKNEYINIIQGKKNLIQTYRFNSLSIIDQQVNHKSISYLIGSLLLQRQDLSYSIALHNMTVSFYYYCQSNQMYTFTILVHASVSQFLISFFSKDYKMINQHLKYIIKRIKFCCPSIVFINDQKNIQIQNFISSWVQSFFFPISQNGSNLKEIILAYLILQNFSRECISRVCQATIISLAKIINQGNRQKCIQVLNNPKYYIDEGLFKDYLLQ